MESESESGTDCSSPKRKSGARLTSTITQKILAFKSASLKNVDQYGELGSIKWNCLLKVHIGDDSVTMLDVLRWIRTYPWITEEQIQPANQPRRTPVQVESRPVIQAIRRTTRKTVNPCPNYVEKDEGFQDEIVSVKEPCHSDNNASVQAGKMVKLISKGNVVLALPGPSTSTSSKKNVLVRILKSKSEEYPGNHETFPAESPSNVEALNFRSAFTSTVAPNRGPALVFAAEGLLETKPSSFVGKIKTQWMNRGMLDQKPSTEADGTSPAAPAGTSSADAAASTYANDSPRPPPVKFAAEGFLEPKSSPFAGKIKTQWMIRDILDQKPSIGADGTSQGSTASTSQAATTGESDAGTRASATTYANESARPAPVKFAVEGFLESKPSSCVGKTKAQWMIRDILGLKTDVDAAGTGQVAAADGVDAGTSQDTAAGGAVGTSQDTASVTSQATVAGTSQAPAAGGDAGSSEAAATSTTYANDCPSPTSGAGTQNNQYYQHLPIKPTPMQFERQYTGYNYGQTRAYDHDYTGLARIGQHQLPRDDYNDLVGAQPGLQLTAFHPFRVSNQHAVHCENVIELLSKMRICFEKLSSSGSECLTEPFNNFTMAFIQYRKKRSDFAYGPAPVHFSNQK